jgi:signal transduction histidine kinase/Tfp pilus assembly protein PilF
MFGPISLPRCFNQFLIVLFCLISGVVTASPDKKLDSMLTALSQHQAEDTTRVNMYVSVAYLYRGQSIDSSQVAAMRGLALAEKIHFEKGAAESLKTIGITWLFKGQYDKAISYAKRALAIYNKMDDVKGISSTLHLMGVTYSRQEKYDTANEYYNKAITWATKNKDTALVSDLLDNLGSSYIAIGNYPEALDYFLRGLRLREQIGFKLTIAVSLSNVASVYSKLHDHKKALDYAGRALAIQLALDHKMGLLYTYESIGNMYREMKDNDNAAGYYRKALSLSDTMGNREQKNILLIHMADIYTDRKQYDSAMTNYTTCLNDTLIRRPLMTANCHSGIGRILVRKGRADAGIGHLLTAFDIFKDNGMKPQVAETANMLSLAFMKAGRDSLAYLYNSISNNYRDSLFNDENEKKIQQLQFDYQLEKKQSQIELLSKTKAISQARSWGLVIGMGLLLVIVALLVRDRMRKKHARNEIIKQKEEIQLQATKLEELNRFKDKTFSVLAHDMRGPLNAFNVTMGMIDEGTISVEEFLELKPAMAQQIGSLTQLLDNLLSWAKSYMKGESVAVPAMVNLYNMAQQNIKLLDAAADIKQITIVNNIPADTYAFCDAEQTDIVIRNLISNAIKFTPANGAITLSAKEVTDPLTNRPMVTMCVTDTGVGMTQEHVNKLFSSTPGNNTYGTHGEKGTGLGLLLCNEFIKANNGAITVHSEAGKGSTFCVSLPKTSMA